LEAIMADADAVSVTLGGMGDKAREWIAQGRYETMSEVVLEGLRALERQDSKSDAILKAKVEEAINDPRPYVSIEEAFTRIRAALPSE
jgi:antitoxin ParD1/3/4